MNHKTLTRKLTSNIRTILVAGVLAYKSSRRKFFYYLSQRKSGSHLPIQEIHPIHPEITSRQEAMEYFLEEGEKFIQRVSQKNEPTERELDELKNSYGFQNIEILRRIKRRLANSEPNY